MNIDEIIPASLAGERLDRTVSLLTGASRSQAARWLAEERIRIDGAVATGRSRRVDTGERLTVSVPETPDHELVGDPDVAFEVLHADDELIVIDKPAGLVVHPGPGHPDGTLVNGLLARFPDLAGVGEPGRPGIVHRLDRGTSGVLAVARTEHAYRVLVAAFAAHEVTRQYRALVAGHPEPGRGLVDGPIGRSASSATRMALTASGRPARTRYEVLERFPGPPACALTECELETGRTHQIRVHLAGIDHPVLGDATYGGVRSGLELARPFLHAHVLALAHPGDGRAVRFVSPLPPDLEAVLTELRQEPPSSARAPHRG